METWNLLHNNQISIYNQLICSRNCILWLLVFYTSMFCKSMCVESICQLCLFNTLILLLYAWIDAHLYKRRWEPLFKQSLADYYTIQLVLELVLNISSHSYATTDDWSSVSRSVGLASWPLVWVDPSVGQIGLRLC